MKKHKKVGNTEKKRIKWDETVIREHDKERGTRNKIDEPKTPFHYMDSEQSEEAEEQNIDLSDLASKLENHISKEEFKIKRREHYNEFKKMQEMRQKIHEEEEEEEKEDKEDKEEVEETKCD
ncbi:unnamed protein product [Blepharisma stoltei]|uniref:Protein phosphatase inhibitor 2 n=1 Tax=Blepharisma stoltei TaxID=1481888 RepID=A0AAU9J643_9CILI|nr:unnamed protein product [Blepharisma stoltei]